MFATRGGAKGVSASPLATSLRQFNHKLQSYKFVLELAASMKNKNKTNYKQLTVIHILTFYLLLKMLFDT